MESKKRGKQVNIEVTPEEWQAMRIINAMQNSSFKEIILTHYKALAASNRVTFPDSKPGRKSGE